LRRLQSDTVTKVLVVALLVRGSKGARGLVSTPHVGMSQYAGGFGYAGGAGGMNSMDVQRNKHVSLLRRLAE
jgi:hypothetical protein